MGANFDRYHEYSFEKFITEDLVKKNSEEKILYFRKT